MTFRSQIVAAALAWTGTPYRHQASVQGVGSDCLGLVRGVWRGLYGREPEAPPPYTRDWAEAHGRETLAEAAARHLVPIPVAEATDGDVVLFSLAPGMPAKHCAILTGAGRMIHAIESHPVAEVTMGPWWRRRTRFAFAFPPIKPEV